MTAESINFEIMRNKKYQTFRVLQAPGIWSDVYRDRIKNFGKYRSSILFPEMILGLNQSHMFSVYHKLSIFQAQVSVTRHPIILHILDEKGFMVRLKTIEQLHRFEERYNLKENLHNIKLNNESFNSDYFCFLAIFTNKEDAIRYASDELRKQIGGF